MEMVYKEEDGGGRGGWRCKEAGEEDGGTRRRARRMEVRRDGQGGWRYKEVGKEDGGKGGRGGGRYEEEEEASYKEIEEAYEQYIRGWNTNTTSNK